MEPEGLARHGLLLDPGQKKCQSFVFACEE